MALVGKLALVADAMLGRLETQAGLLGIPVAMPNAAFVPDFTVADWFIEARFFPNSPKAEGITTGLMDHGILQISAVFQRNMGAIVVLEAAEALKTMFPKNLELFNGGFKTTVHRAPYASSPFDRVDQYVVPVIVEWSS